MQEPLLFEARQYNKDDNWVFSNITMLIQNINKQSEKISNQDIAEFIVQESDCLKILNELKCILKENPNDEKLHRKIFNHFIPKRAIKVILLGTLADLVQVASLLLLDRSTTALREFHSQDIYVPILYLLAMLCTQVFKTILNSLITIEGNLSMLRVRIILQYLIFMKALRTQCIGKKDESNYVANINTLLTADISQIMHFQSAIKDGWSAFLILISCLIILLMRDVKAGLIIISVLLIGQVYNISVTYMMVRSKQQMLKEKDQRVTLTTDVIEGMKQIKYLTWQETFSNKIMAIRKREFKQLALLKFFDGLCSIFWNNISYVLLCFYITNLVYNGHSLEEINVFTLIAIFNTMTFPLGILPWCVNTLLLGRVSLQRINGFLNCKEIDPENRLFLDQSQESEHSLIMDNVQYQWPVDDSKKNNNKQTAIEPSDVDDNRFILSVNQVRIIENTLNFVIGKIGSGKSAFFNAILNELQLANENICASRTQSLQSAISMVSHQIIIKGSISYCAQQSWVQNATIRQNIIFGKAYDKELLDEVLRVCDLTKDINLFENKDLHEVGPDGKNLSGGQKQRIALARAFYQDSDIYLLDDVFSSLDVHVADNIFQNGILGYLMAKGKTILFITSHYRYISSNANVIYIENGQIIDNKEQIQAYIREQQSKQEQEQKEAEIQQHQLIDKADVLPELKKKQSSQKEEEIQITEEEREKGTIKGKTWLLYFSSMNWILLFIFVVLNFAMQGCLSLVDFWIKSELNGTDNWMHKITLFFDDNFTKTFMYLTILSVTVTFVRALAYVSVSLKSAWTIFERLNKSLMYAIMKIYDENNSGRIINRISDDTETVDDYLVWLIHVMGENLSRVAGLGIGLLILFPVMGFGFIIVFFLYYKLSQIYTKANRELKRLRSINSGQLLGVLNEMITGIKTIRAFQKETYLEDCYQSSLNTLIISDQCANRASYWFSVRLQLLGNLLVFFIILLQSLILVLQIDVAYSTCALALTYSLVILSSANDCFEFYLQTEQAMISIERIGQYYDNPQEILNEQTDWIQIQDSQYAVEFQAVNLSYNKSKQALNNISFQISKNEKIAFVGRTGSGKTSIFNVLFKLYEYTGDVIIQGENTSTMSLAYLRQKLSIVPQFGFLYNATVKDNLDPDNRYSQQEIEDHFVKIGFNLRTENNQSNAQFMIQPNGANLSNGEKQVLNFIRIMLQNKDIICLDEATSNMDPQTDQVLIYNKQLLHNLLFTYVQDRTLIVITHRLENIQKYDRIVVMDKGNIVEIGSYQELMKSQTGFFSKLLEQKE